jgi:cytochrome bd-type quinol oxidase subunit 1
LADHKPWFFVMMPEDADRPGAQRDRREGISRGRMVVWPIALEGWVALLAFVATAIAVPLAVWLGMVLPGLMSTTLAMVWTVIVEAILAATFILLVQSRMTSPVAVQRPKRVTDGWDQTFQILW